VKYNLDFETIYGFTIQIQDSPCVCCQIKRKKTTPCSGTTHACTLRWTWLTPYYSRL